MGDDQLTTQPVRSTGENLMTGTVTVGGEDIPVDSKTTFAELREMKGITDSTRNATWADDQDELHIFNDEDYVLRKVPDGATISFQDSGDAHFG